jgi:hypothetical protein
MSKAFFLSGQFKVIIAIPLSFVNKMSCVAMSKSSLSVMVRTLHSFQEIEDDPIEGFSLVDVGSMTGTLDDGLGRTRHFGGHVVRSRQESGVESTDHHQRRNSDGGK